MQKTAATKFILQAAMEDFRPGEYCERCKFKHYLVVCPYISRGVREAKKKNWLVSTPNAPSLSTSMHHLVYNKKKTGTYTAYVQLKKPLYRHVIAELFPGATYVEPFAEGYTKGRKAAFGRLVENDGPTVVLGGDPIYRGIPAQETFQQAEARRQRQYLLCRPQKRTYDKLGAFAQYLPLKKRKK